MVENGKIEDIVWELKTEQKTGFDRIRKMISDKCSTQYAAERVAAETFSSAAPEIRKRLLLTDEMRLILMCEERVFRREDSLTASTFSSLLRVLPTT